MGLGQVTDLTSAGALEVPLILPINRKKIYISILHTKNYKGVDLHEN
jgi:hypothetical protein